MNLKKMKSDFFISLNKYMSLSDKATDFYIKSWKFDKGSLERQICLLKRELYNREARKYLYKSIEITEKWINSNK